ncbi:MAG: BrnT family toxin, partial [Methylococcales bacterium]
MRHEERWITLGRNLNQTILLVIHTWRQGERTRFFSARTAT